MTINIGNTDRLVRLLSGASLIALALFSGVALFDGAAIRYGAVLLGGVLIATAAMRMCPLYSVLGVQTCKV